MIVKTNLDTISLVNIPSAINKILRKRSAELRKYSCYSTWYYDEETRKIVICTTRPGLWIGLHGIDTNNLQDRINEILAHYNIEPVCITYIECES